MAGKGPNLSLMNKQAIVNEGLVRKSAQRAWDATRKGKELQEIDRALREGSYGRADVRLQAPVTSQSEIDPDTRLADRFGAQNTTRSN